MILIVAFGAIALIARWYFTVESFYEYGHYRASSVPEIAAQEPAYKTASYCQGCHAERHAQWSANNHKSVTCETCHGAAQGHPEKGKLPIPADTVKLCTLCHEAMPGRPSTQPQIQVAAHSGGQQCKVCHNPHAPKIAAAAVRVAGDVAAGKQRAAACAGCHGADGISPNDTWPSLAGQSAAYLARILAAYKSGDQKDVVMTPLAQPLGDGDIRNLAAYYASLSCRTVPSAVRAGNAATGRALAKNCAVCHGATGISGNPAWPHLAGQKISYLVNVLKAFRGGLRKDPMMAAVVRGLSDADIEDLAAFYAAQNCRPVTQARKAP